MPELPDGIECQVGDLPPEAKAIRDGLVAFNTAQVGDASRLPLCLWRRDEAGRLVGGLVGEVTLHWLMVDKLWIDDRWRGRGLGTALIRAAEARAVALGAVGAHLHTSSYQAPAFYARLGYEVIGRLPGRPVGQSRFWLARRFDGQPLEAGDIG